MLSCIVGKQNINTIDYPEKQLREWAKRKLLKCPVCGESLLYRHGMIKIPHFAHEKDSDCTYTFFENETKHHMVGKVLLYKWLKQLDSIKNLELESYIKETKQRPDLYFELNDDRYVIEYQCTPITLEEYLERKELYRLNGIIDIWILGTENFNFNSSGKIKMKVLDSKLFSEKKLYYFNPFEEIIYYVVRPSKYVGGRFKVYSHDIKDKNNFYIGNKSIVINEMVCSDFKVKLSRLLKSQKEEHEKEVNQLIEQQQEIYNQIKEEAKIEKIKYINVKVNEMIKNKNIYFYNSMKRIEKEEKNKNFKYMKLRGNQLKKEWLFEDIYESINKVDFNTDINILILGCDFKKGLMGYLRSIFPNNNVVFVEGT